MKLLMTQVEAHINFVNNNKAFNKLVNAEIYKVYNIDMNNDLSEADIKFDSKYVSKLFIAAKDTYFASKFIEESKYKFIVTVDTQKAVEATRENLVKELNSEVAKKLDPTVRTDLLNILSDMNRNEATQKDLPKIIKAINISNKISQKYKNLKITSKFTK